LAKFEENGIVVRVNVNQWIRVGVLLAATAAATAGAQTMYVVDKLMVGLHEGKDQASTLLKALPTGTPLEVLERDDKFAKVRAPDGTTGWMEAGYLMKQKPAQLLILEVEDKYRRTRERLAKAEAALEQLEKTVKQGGAATAAKQLQTDKAALAKELEATKARLQKALAENAGPQKGAKPTPQAGGAELAATRTKLSQLEQELQAKGTELSRVGEQVKKLEAANAALRERISKAVALLGGGGTAAPDNPGHASIEQAPPAPTHDTEGTPAGPWPVLAMIIAAVAGFFAGAVWLDRRQLKRHGGFRI